MKKLFILIFLFIISSCSINKNISNEPSEVPDIPIEEEPEKEKNPFVKDIIDDSKYENIMYLSKLINLNKISSVKLFDNSLANVEVEELRNHHNNVEMIKCNKIENGKYLSSYRYAIKDTRKNIRIEIEENNFYDCYYIGESGYIYYFLDNFYYVSKEVVSYNFINSSIELLDLVGSFKQIYIINGLDIIRVDDKDLFIKIFANVNMIINKNVSIYDVDINGYINNKCKEGIIIEFDELKLNISKEGIIIEFDELKLNISKEGKIYIFKDYLYVNSFVDERNYYDLVIEYLNKGINLNESTDFGDETYLSTIIDISNAKEIVVYPKNGYNTKDKILDFSLFNNIKMVKKIYDDNYYVVINDIDEEIKISFYLADYCRNVYIGLSGHIYYFLDNCYYMSLNSSFYDLMISNIDYIYRY